MSWSNADYHTHLRRTMSATEFLADMAAPGDVLTVTFADGKSRRVVVLETFMSGTLKIALDYRPVSGEE